MLLLYKKDRYNFLWLHLSFFYLETFIGLVFKIKLH